MSRLTSRLACPLGVAAGGDVGYQTAPPPLPPPPPHQPNPTYTAHAHIHTLTIPGLPLICEAKLCSTVVSLQPHVIL